MGTLSKALGSYGGYVCASSAVIDLLKTRARTLIYSTGLPPACVAAALAALDIVQSEPELTTRPLAKAQAFTRACNLPLATSQIVAVVLGEPLAALEASQILEREGFLVTPSARPPCQREPRGCASPSPPAIPMTRSRDWQNSCASGFVMSAYFVTGTGTDIGKTFVTAGLIRTLRAAGKPVRALKPVVSGFDGIHHAHQRSRYAFERDGRGTEDAIARISPWRFAAPLAPDMAAAKEGRAVDFEALVAFCRMAIAEPGTLFIEGVGGVMVPLDMHNTVLNWIAALRIPAILVAGSYLGTISHTLTALDAMAHAGVKVAALVINDGGDGAVPLDDTAAALSRFAPGLTIATPPRAAPAKTPGGGLTSQ